MIFQDDDEYYEDLRVEVGEEIEKRCGAIEKLTVFEVSGCFR
jgi:hypothetical protein